MGRLERRQLLVLLQERVWESGTWALTPRTRMRFITSLDSQDGAVSSRGIVGLRVSAILYIIVFLELYYSSRSNVVSVLRNVAIISWFT